MQLQKIVDALYSHWTFKVTRLIAAYFAIVLFGVNVLYPFFQSLNLQNLSWTIYSLYTIVPYFFLMIIYSLLILFRSKNSNPKSLLDIFPTYASFIRIFAGFAIAIVGIFQGNIRSLATTYIIFNIIVGTLSLFPSYYDLKFRLIRVFVDIVLASLICFFYGGITTPFVLLYFIPITVAARYFEPNQSRLVTLAASFFIFVITFVEYQSNPIQIFGRNQNLMTAYITVVLVLFAIGEIIFAERRERILPLQNFLLKINSEVQQNSHICVILDLLSDIICCEKIIVVTSDGNLAMTTKQIGMLSAVHKELKFAISLYGKYTDSLKELHNGWDSPNWEHMYDFRHQISKVTNIFLKSILDHEEKIFSAVHVPLSQGKGFIIAINSKNANKTVVKQFTRDKYEYLLMCSTVIDDHAFFL